MKRRYDVPLGRKVWVVEEDRVGHDYAFSPSTSIAALRWEVQLCTYPVQKRFTSYHQAASYFVKQKLLSTHEVQLREETIQDFSMWRKR